jgi:low affinity Fe/Cu permease
MESLSPWGSSYIRRSNARSRNDGASAIPQWPLGTFCIVATYPSAAGGSARPLFAPEIVMKATLPASLYGSPPRSAAPAWFGRLATTTASISGRPTTFLLAAGVVVVWAITGPLFNYSDTWQLVINTGTTIVTFLMVFLIQHTQNRDTLALQVKLDELILATKAANDAIAGIEEAPEDVVESVKEDIRNRAKAAERKPLRNKAEASGR